MSGFTNAVCGGADILRVIKFVWILLELVNWIVPMALIVMISIDFFKNVMSGKEDEMRKNLNLVIKRILFCVALFFVMPIVEFIVGMFAVETETDWVDTNGKKVNWATCIHIATTADNFDAYEINWEEGNSSGADGTSSLDGLLNSLNALNEYTVSVGESIIGLTHGPIVAGDTIRYNPDTGKYHILNEDGSFGDESWTLDEIIDSAEVKRNINSQSVDIVKALNETKQYTVPSGKVITGLVYGPRVKIGAGETIKYNPDTDKYHILNSDGSFELDSWTLQEIVKSAKLEANSDGVTNSNKKTDSADNVTDTKTQLRQFLDLRIQPVVWKYSYHYNALSADDKNKLNNAYTESLNFVANNPIKTEWKKSQEYINLSDLANELLSTKFKSHKEQFCYELKIGGAYVVPDDMFISNVGVRNIIGGEHIDFDLNKGEAYVTISNGSKQTYEIDKLEDANIFVGNQLESANKVSCSVYNK